MCPWCWEMCWCPWWRRSGFHYEYSGDEADKFFKLVLFGGPVGKTALRHKFSQMDEAAERASALATSLDYSVREMDLGGEPITLQICECSADEEGQDDDDESPMASLQLADGIFLVYDITNRKSLLLLKEAILSKEVLPYICRAAHLVVLGTNSDLEDGKREVLVDEGKAFADKVGADFAETSTKTGENVSKALFSMAARVAESSGSGNEKNKDQRLAMPWTNADRLQESLSNTPQEKISSQQSLAVPGKETEEATQSFWAWGLKSNQPVPEKPCEEAGDDDNNDAGVRTRSPATSIGSGGQPSPKGKEESRGDGALDDRRLGSPREDASGGGSSSAGGKNGGDGRKSSQGGSPSGSGFPADSGGGSNAGESSRPSGVASPCRW